MVLVIALIKNSDVMALQTVQINRMRLAVSFVERINNILMNFRRFYRVALYLYCFLFFILQLVSSTLNFPAMIAVGAFLVNKYVIGLRIAMMILTRREMGRNVVSMNLIKYQDVLLILFWVSRVSFLTYNVFCSFSKTEIGPKTGRSCSHLQVRQKRGLLR